MMRYRLSAIAQEDIVDILAWTHERFGDLARKRYETLIVTALRDIATQPSRAGSSERSELGGGMRSWHLRLSRDRARVAGGMVHRPRHFLIYRVENDMIVIGRVLHDAMELTRHLEGDKSWV
ncbi:plasmid stabilization protein ParE [Bordetella sp. J329]|uniref:type II toxin-antitoxin system RelE/ParE family toxin n=1 Tax=Kerstersia gyiorum TaxID=206506 RepID=UPI000FD9DD56|nr:plasmid stabilization protein ParE [Bordetella sp. J329]